ncbi:NAD-dependent epimerase/dehydratase family protein [Marinospirillum sp.]|uniref:NAD-dependent epimerase/dehydratase family protein n=1 Tax=Marinospirillum sp. TaxID=2183934 RepID=UPI00385179D0
MSENKKVVGICSIGSGVGQSVISSCNATSLPIITLGLGNNPLAYGQYECDDYAYIPSYYSENYLEKLLEICKEKKVELLIPGHDDEAQLLADNEPKLKEEGIELLASSIELINICRSKDKLAHFFSEASDLFVKSYTYKEIANNKKSTKEIFPLIAKPRNGYASKNVHIVRSREELEKLDDELIYQEIAIPEKSDPARDFYLKNLEKGINAQIGELSIQLVADKKGKIHGRFATYNKLNNGIPIEILPYESSKLDKALDRLIPLIQEKGLKGPINLQGRMTDEGLKIFEINPRFTGITGLRAKFGFNEVSACIKNWLFNVPMQNLSYNKNSAGIRQTADKIVNWKEKPEKETILITGSTGAVGQQLVKILSENKKYIIYTLDRSPEKSIYIHGKLISKALSWNDIDNDRFNLGLIGTLCHLASARPYHTSLEIAESLERTQKIFTKSVSNGIQQIIYASSQSVYGEFHDIPWNEQMIPSPTTCYAMTKYSGELILQNLFYTKRSFKHISLRLATLTGENIEIAETEATAKIARKIARSENITIYNGDQIFNRMHVKDAANAFYSIIKSGIKKNEILNVSYEKSLSLNEIVNLCKKISSKSRSKIYFEFGSSLKSHIMDSKTIKNKYKWRPELDLNKAIELIVNDEEKKVKNEK